MKRKKLIKENRNWFQGDKKYTFSNYLLWGLLYVLMPIMVLINLIVFANAQTSQTSSGTTYTNIARAGSSSSWTNAINAVSSNNVYATPTANLPNSGNYTDYLQSTNFNFSIPANSIISGIEVYIERSDGNGKSKDSRVRLIKDGIIGSSDKSKNPAWGGVDGVQSYGGNSDLWSNVWTAADINSSNFGIAFACQRTGGGGQPTLSQVDEIVITVYYFIPLPIELISFNAYYRDNTIDIIWETAAELNNDYFTLERSHDGITFHFLAWVNGAGNSTVNNSYAFKDKNPITGTSFYRLKQTDFDGNYETFKVISVAQSEKKKFELKVIQDLLNESISIQFETSENKYVTFKIIDMNGALKFSQLVSAEIGTNNFFISTETNFKQGVYLLLALDNRELIARKIIIFNGK